MAKQEGAEVSDKVRVQIDVTAAHLAAMDQLMTFCGLSKRKELFDVSMSLFAWAVGEAREGRRIASYDRENDHIETVLVPALEFARTRAAQVRVVSDAGSARSPLKAVGENFELETKAATAERDSRYKVPQRKPLVG